MKNKKSIYILLPLVLVVWATILYKIFSNFNDNDEPGLPNYHLQSKSKKKIFVKDTFELLLNYPDPFLKKAPKTTSSSQSYNNIKKRLIGKHKINWPNIKYHGRIKNSVTKAEKINIRINQKMYLMKPYEKKADVKLLKIYNDSIIITYKNEIKTITKN